MSWWVGGSLSFQAADQHAAHEVALKEQEGDSDRPIATTAIAIRILWTGNSMVCSIALASPVVRNSALLWMA